MPLAAKLTDKGTRHDGYYETVITAGSSTVFIDGLPAARQGDPLTPHAKPKHPPHPRKIQPGRRLRPNTPDKSPAHRLLRGNCLA